MSKTPRSANELKKAINGAKKVYVFATIGQMQATGTPVGGYIEVYKSHLLGLMKNFMLPTASWDKTVSCFFRFDLETEFLYVEGFQAA